MPTPKPVGAGQGEIVHFTNPNPPARKAAKAAPGVRTNGLINVLAEETPLTPPQHATGPMAQLVTQAIKAGQQIGPCPDCGEPTKTTAITLFGRDTIVPCVCECQVKRRDDESALQARMMGRDKKIERFAGALPLRPDWTTRLGALRDDLESPDKGLLHSRTFLATHVARLSQGHGMFFFGSPGTGKSTVSLALANELHALGYFTVWGKLKAIAERAWDHDKRVLLQEAIEHADLLVLDELIHEGENRHTVSTLFTLVDARYELGKSTILTSNFDTEAIAKHYLGLLAAEGEAKAQMMVDRFLSRLLPPRYKRVPFEGPDLRLVLMEDW